MPPLTLPVTPPTLEALRATNLQGMLSICKAKNDSVVNVG